MNSRKFNPSSVSGLSWQWIRECSESYDLERNTSNGEPIYLHQPSCAMTCNHACNGNRGRMLACDVSTFGSILPKTKEKEL